jgi:hypothetical protein
MHCSGPGGRPYHHDAAGGPRYRRPHCFPIPPAPPAGQSSSFVWDGRNGCADRGGVWVALCRTLLHRPSCLIAPASAAAREQRCLATADPVLRLSPANTRALITASAQHSPPAHPTNRAPGALTRHGPPAHALPYLLDSPPRPPRARRSRLAGAVRLEHAAERRPRPAPRRRLRQPPPAARRRARRPTGRRGQRSAPRPPPLPRRRRRRCCWLVLLARSGRAGPGRRRSRRRGNGGVEEVPGVGRAVGPTGRGGASRAARGEGIAERN